MRRRSRIRDGFTLIELLVVIAIIAILAAMLLPVLAKAKARAHTTKCASNMRNWAFALQMYKDDYRDCLPFFASLSASQSNAPYVFEILAPYVAKQTTAQIQSTVQNAEVRQCPAGSYGPEPFGGGTPTTAWNCWIGVNFGGYGNPLCGFYYEFSGSATAGPFKASKVKKPNDALMFMDTTGYYVYSLILRPLDDDSDGDGVRDTIGSYKPFSHGRPTVHNNGANVTLLDGHVERVAYKKLWQVDAASKPLHSFWYYED